MVLLDKLFEELKEVCLKEIDLNNKHYFLFFEDGVFTVYFDEDDKEMKVDVQFSDGIEVYHTKAKLEDIFKEVN